MSLQQNGRRSFAPVQFALQVLRANELLKDCFYVHGTLQVELNSSSPQKRLWRGVQGLSSGNALSHGAGTQAGRGCPLVPWPWEVKPPPAPTSTLEFPLDVESTRMVWRELLQGPGTDIKGRYVASFATRGSCRTAPLPSAGGSSCTGPEAIMEQPAQEGARAKILFLTCFLFI